MPVSDVQIIVPYSLENKGHGNIVSAERLAGQLEKKWQVELRSIESEVSESRCLIALNAWRSADAIRKFRKAFPQSPVAVILTGTDINDERIEDETWEGRRTMEDADHLVVLQEEAYKRVPNHLQDRCTLIRPSVVLPVGCQHTGNDEKTRRIIAAGRLRPEKQVPLVQAACRRLPDTAEIKIEWYGATSEIQAPHFQWMGEVAQEELWKAMAGADLFLNASSQEGGANAVCEAITMGLPVIASRIGGNLGLLGEDYEGYFEADDAAGLAQLMENAPTGILKAQVMKRSTLFDPTREAQQWNELLKSMIS